MTKQTYEDFTFLGMGICTKDECPTCEALSRLRALLEAQQAELEGYRRFKASVDEALNSGDGAYRP